MEISKRLLDKLGFDRWNIPRIGYSAGDGSRGKWYVSKAVGWNEEVDDLEIQYLHKDFTWHSYCGADNFFETKEEVEMAILKADGFLSPEEMNL